MLVQSYGGGIFTGGGCSINLDDANHALALVGYGYTNGKGYYILRNSWGEMWGEKGYMFIQSILLFVSLSNHLLYCSNIKWVKMCVVSLMMLFFQSSVY